MHGSNHRALDVAVVCEVHAFLFHTANIPNRRCTGCQKAYDIACVRHCATIRMGSGGTVRAKPPSTKPIDRLAFEDLLRFALWRRFETAGH
eukprot:6483192-Amphidinium_carterae.1